MSGRTLPDVRPLWQSCSIADNYNIAIRVGFPSHGLTKDVLNGKWATVTCAA